MQEPSTKLGYTERDYGAQEALNAVVMPSADIAVDALRGRSARVNDLVIRLNERLGCVLKEPKPMAGTEATGFSSIPQDCTLTRNCAEIGDVLERTARMLEDTLDRLAL